MGPITIRPGRLAATRSRPRVLVVQPMFAHYRFAVFRELSESREFDFSFAAGADSSDGDIHSFERAELPRTEWLENRWRGHLLWQGGLIRLVRRRYSAIVFTGGVNYVSTWIAALIARLLGTKVLFWTTGWHRPDHGTKRLIRLAFYRLAHRLLLYNDRGAVLGAEAGYPRDRMTVIYNSQGSPPSPFEALNNGTASEEEAAGVTLLAVVRLNASKKLDQLLKAASLLTHAGHSIRVVLVGEGPEKGRLRELALELGVKLILPGALYEAQRLASLYESSLLTVVPGAVGLTAIQSLKHGVPVISNSSADSQVAEWEAIRPGITGGLFIEDDIEDLARTIEVWIGIMSERSAEVQIACAQEYDGKWSPKNHAERIKLGLHETL